MLELLVFLDQHFGEHGRPDGWDGPGVRSWWGVLLFFLLFSTVGVYVVSHLLRLR